MNLISFLEKNMLNCSWKEMGLDCMGCGLQRSFIHLLKGEFMDAFYMYPPIYSLILLFGFLILHLKFQFKIGPKILIGLFIFNLFTTFGNYLIKFY